MRWGPTALFLSAFSYLLAVSPASAALTLANSPVAGNGTVSSVTPTGFVLTGADFGANDSLGGFEYITTYTDTATSDITVTFDWSFATQDPQNDAGGFIVGTGGALLAATPDSGTAESFTVAAGETFGWFVLSADSLHGPGVLTISNIEITDAPEPMSLAVLGAACGMLGLARSARRTRGN